MAVRRQAKSAARWLPVSLMALLLVGSFLSAAARAHLDPPGPPAIRVRVWISGWATTVNLDDVDVGDADGTTAEIQTDYHVVHTGGHGGAKDSRIDTYSWKKHGGALDTTDPGHPGTLLWNHVECTPMSRIVITFSAEEVDDFPAKPQALGHGAVTFDAAGTKNDTTAGGGSQAHATIAFTVTAEALSEQEARCAER